MLISVVIPTRGKADLVRRSLEHLRRSVLEPECRLEILILEQAGETCRELVREDRERPVRWMPAAPDWNFSQINNAGAEAGRGEALLLLNNDCFVETDCLAHLVAELDREPRVGVVGAKLLFEDGRLQHIGVAIHRGGHPGHYSRGAPDDGSVGTADTDASPDAVTFACALVRRSCWQDVGGLDPAYHFNYEDVDFCLAARARGWDVRYLHRARAVHLEGVSRGDDAPYLQSTERNFEVFAAKWLHTGRLETLLGRRFEIAQASRDAVAPARGGSGMLGRALAEAWRALTGRR